jgi:diacylglycerol kinase (ATP)
LNRLVVISNPRSKKSLKEPELHADLAAIVGTMGRVESPDGFAAVNALAVQLLQDPPDLIAINGGDGTVGVVMTALHKAWDDGPFPEILLLRGGTMNTVAKNLSLRGKPRALLRQAVKRLSQGESLRTKTRWMLVVNGRLCFWFGNGVISNFLRPYYEGSTPSPLKGLYILLRAVASAVVGGHYAKTIASRQDCVLEIDGQRCPQRQWLALGAGTLVDVGLGFRAFYRLRHHAGAIHILGWACSPFRMALTLPRVYFGLPLRHADLMDVLGTELRIEGKGTLHYMVDGDLLTADSEIRIGVSRPIQWVVPRDA